VLDRRILHIQPKLAVRPFGLGIRRYVFPEFLSATTLLAPGKVALLRMDGE
jgi:hypothetical protein